MSELRRHGTSRYLDLAIIALAMKFFIDMCPPGVVKQHLDDLAGRVTGKEPAAETGPVVEGDYRVID